MSIEHPRKPVVRHITGLHVDVKLRDYGRELRGPNRREARAMRLELFQSFTSLEHLLTPNDKGIYEAFSPGTGLMVGGRGLIGDRHIQFVYSDRAVGFRITEKWPIDTDSGTAPELSCGYLLRVSRERTSLSRQGQSVLFIHDSGIKYRHYGSEEIIGTPCFNGMGHWTGSKIGTLEGKNIAQTVKNDAQVLRFSAE